MDLLLAGCRNMRGLTLTHRCAHANPHEHQCAHLHRTGSSATSRQPHELPLDQCTNTEAP